MRGRVPRATSMRHGRGFRSDMTIQDDVRGFIVETFFVADAAELTDELSLIDTGIIDSTGMLDVILYLEERYGFHVEDSVFCLEARNGRGHVEE